MPAVVKTRTEEGGRLLGLVTAVAGQSQDTAIQVDASLPGACLLPGSDSACTLKDAVLFLAAPAPQLLGASDDLKVAACVEQYIELDLPSAETLAQLNAELEPCTFLAGSTATLADLVVYAAVAPALAKSEVSPELCSLLRWYDHVHRAVDCTGVFPTLQLSKPAFVPPAAPPAAKIPAAADKGAAKSKDGNQKSSGESKPGDKAAAAMASLSLQAGTPAGEAGAPVGKAKKEKKAKSAAATEATQAAPAQAAAANDEPRVDLLDLRVGKIVSVERHPNADALYVEKIDLGEAEPRQIVSGLVKFVPVEAMQDRMVVVVTNLKPAKMRDVMSYGMVLCASNDAHDKVDPIIVPEGVQPGERITFEGYTNEPEAQLNPRKKQFEKIAPNLVVSADGVCKYKDIPFTTSKGVVIGTIPGAHIA